MDLRKEYITLKKELFDIYYRDLNNKQREAVYAVNGPVLILAGAGSGKTTVLVNRIAHIIRFGDAYNSDLVPEFVSEDTIEEMKKARTLGKRELGDYLTKFAVSPAPAWSVMGITFTNKAAGEIKTRIGEIFGEESDEYSSIMTGTFHSVCCRFLRRYGSLVGYDTNFSICDTADSKNLITECMKRLDIDEKTLAVKSVQNTISKAKDKLMTPEDLAGEAGNDFKLKKIAEIYSVYQERLKTQNLLDFDDIIMATVELLSGHEDVRNTLQRRYRYICVDEYQDTNFAQLRLTLLLSGYYKNIMVVGDEDQSIYKFRGAVIENILSFDQNYDNTRVIKLEENYRSTQTILDAANSIISHNTGRLGKTLWTQSEKGDPIIVSNLDTQIDEGRYISTVISDERTKNGFSFRDFAVLYRMNAQSRAIEQALVKSAIPYRVLGGLRFFERLEVKDIVSYLYVINNPMDDVRLRRIINTPRRGIGNRSVEIAVLLAYEEGFSLLEFMRNARKYSAISPSASKSMQEFAFLIDSLRESVAKMTVSNFIMKVIDDSGYERMIREIENKTERDERLSNLDELINTAKQYEQTSDEPSLSGFLEEVALISDVDRYDDEADAVVLMTIHSAKGLEFPIVFLPGMEENVFPGYQTIMNPEELEEERRLAYVAVTRAKKKVYISHVNSRMLNGQTQMNQISRFVREIPDSLIQQTAMDSYRSPYSSGYYGKRTGSAFSGKYNYDWSAGKPETKQSKPKTPLEVFEVGDNVSHGLFGNGVILSVKQMGGDILYEVVFEEHGTKKLMATFAKLKKIN